MLPSLINEPRDQRRHSDEVVIGSYKKDGNYVYNYINNIINQYKQYKL